MPNVLRQSRIFVVITALCMVMFSAPAAPANARPPWCGGDGPIDASDLPERVPAWVCDLVGRTISDHGADVVVGPPGTGVFTEALLGDGQGAEILDVYTGDDGTVDLRHVGSEASPSVAAQEQEAFLAATAPPACDDPAYNLNGIKESHRHEWRMKRSSIPSGMNKDATVTAVRNGGANITSADDCNREDQVSARIKYLGTTSKSANLSSGTCVGYGSKDEVNVVDFGYIKKKSNGNIVVGKACLWYIWNGYNELVEADVRLNKSHANWYNSGSCNNKYHVESVMTHERGHTFGLGHVSSDHKHLTMFGTTYKCNKKQRTLGWGDIRGLRALY